MEHPAPQTPEQDLQAQPGQPAKPSKVPKIRTRQGKFEPRGLTEDFNALHGNEANNSNANELNIANANNNIGDITCEPKTVQLMAPPHMASQPIVITNSSGTIFAYNKENIKDSFLLIFFNSNLI